MKKIHIPVKKKLMAVVLSVSLLSMSSCSKILDIPLSKNQVESPVVYADSTTAKSALQGIYFSLGTPSSATNIYFKNLALYTDEMSYSSTSPVILQFVQGSLLSENGQNASLWNSLYNVVYQCNAFIAGMETSSTIGTPTKRRLVAEARFLRAFAYHYLVNLYHHVPLILTTDVNANRLAKQADKAVVENQIIADLVAAKADLGAVGEGGNRVRASRIAAGALLARVYLYQGKWPQAFAEANAIINLPAYQPLPNLGDVFLSTSRETILQFWNPNGFIGDATSLIPSSATAIPQFTISGELWDAFEAADRRKTQWISVNQVTAGGMTTRYPYFSKYKNRTTNAGRPEYLVAIRLSELYLIRAEALAQQDQLELAINDLNAIRLRAGLDPLPFGMTKEECLTAILQERRLELFGEWAHRLLDLKRKGNIDAVLGTIKPNWRPVLSQHLPIPFNEIIYNHNLKQHEGY